MNTQTVKQFTSTLLILAFVFCGTNQQLLAQDSNNADTTKPSKKAHIKIFQDKDGEVTKIDRQIDINNKEDFDKLLEELHVDKGIKLDFDGDGKLDIDIDTNSDKDGNGNQKTRKRIMIFDEDETVEAPDNQAFLGVILGEKRMKKKEDINGEVTETEDIKGGSTRIMDIVEGSAAAEAGLQEGDVITSIDNQKVSTMKEVIEQLNTCEVGQQVAINYMRDGKENSTSATLKKRDSLHKDKVRVFKWSDKEGKTFHFDSDDIDIDKWLDGKHKSDEDVHIFKWKNNGAENIEKLHKHLKDLDIDLKDFDIDINQLEKDLKNGIEGIFRFEEKQKDDK